MPWLEMRETQTERNHWCPARIDLRELAEATKEFTPQLKIGEGGFGSVFKGSSLQKMRDLLSEMQMERSRALEDLREMKSKHEEAITKQKIAQENSDADEKCGSKSRRRRHEDHCGKEREEEWEREREGGRERGR